MAGAQVARRTRAQGESGEFPAEARRTGVLLLVLLLSAAGVGLALRSPLTVGAGDGGGSSATTWPDDRVEPSPEEAADLRGLHGRTGFGASAEGGLRGQVRWVTHLRDAGQGSLRHALAAGQPVWIRFRPGLSGTLRLQTPVRVPSRTTIDGRGADVRVEGHGLELERSRDVVLAFLTFDARRGWADYLGNAAVLLRGASRVFIHKCSFVGGGRGVGGVGVLFMDGSKDATLSWSRFVRWDKPVLVGSDPRSPSSGADRITLHHNLLDRTQQRNPLVRFGRVHSYNNWLRHWGSPGFGLGMQVTSGGALLSEGDIFDGRHERPALTSGEFETRDIPPGYTRYEGSVFTDISSFLIEEHRPNVVFEPPYRRSVDVADDRLRRALDEGAGWHRTGGS